MLNKKDNRNELSDEDILRGINLSDNSTKPQQEIGIQSKEAVVNDFVDSSLFVMDELEENNNIQAPRIITQSNKVSNPANLSKKSNDLIKPEVPQSAKDKNEYFKDEVLSNNSDENVILIKADKNDGLNYSKWKIAGFTAVLLVVGAGIYGFFINKKETVVKNEAVIELPVQENILPENNIVQVEEEKALEIDYLKMKVDVYNASGVAGAAGKIKDLLLNAKYENVEAKNYAEDMVGITIVYQKEEYKDGAQEIADILKKNNDEQEIKLSIAEKEIESEVLIILGK